MKTLKNIQLVRTFLILTTLLIIIGGLLDNNIINAQSIREEFPVANGNVYAFFEKDNLLFLGGSFSALGPKVQNLTLLDKNTAQFSPGFPQSNGVISVIIPDGNGGFYIGGNFSMVGDSLRKNVAHILSNNTVDSWNPVVTDEFGGGSVYDLALYNNVIYIAGNFTIVNGVTKNYLAAVDINGNLLNWNPNPDWVVYTLAVIDSSLLVGGSFTTIGGQQRNYLASFELNTGIITSWNPNPNNSVTKIVTKDTLIFVGGTFTSIASQNRELLAAFGKSGGLILTWIANVSGTGRVINTLCIQDNTLYIGGKFSAINDIPRTNLAAVNLNGNLLSWEPVPNNIVNIIYGFDNKIFIGGIFTQVNNQNVSALAALDPVTGALLSWNPSLSSKSSLSVNAINSDGSSKICVGGQFGIVNAIPRGGLAAINLSTNELLPLNAIIENGTVYSLLVLNNTLYFSGSFTSVNGIQRNGIAAINLSNGQLKDWNPNANSTVSALVNISDKIYLGGSFTSVSEQPRNYLAVVDTFGNLLGWSPNPNNRVLTLAVSNDIIYVGGLFTNIGSQTRNRLAAIDTSGNILSWNPNSGGVINSLAIKDSVIYVGGAFFNIGGITRQRLAAIDKNGNVLNWVYNANGVVNKVAIVDKYFYASGNFTTINGTSRKRFVAVDLDNNILRDFQIDLDVTGYALEFDQENGVIFLGGGFNSVNSRLRTGIAAIFDPEIIPPSRPQPPSNLTAVADTFSVYLSWNDNSNNETGFILERKDDSLHIPGSWTVIATLPANATSFVDTGLTPNTTYSYKISAYNSVGISVGDSIHIKTLQIPPTFVQTIFVNKGWNIVSVPLISNDMRKTSLFPNAVTPAYGYSENYYAADTLIIGKGYWLKFAQSDSVRITGRKSLTDSLYLQSGWSLIGPFDYPVNTNQISTVPPEIISSNFFEYNNGYKITSQLTPGKGYWIKLSQSGILILDSSVTKSFKQIQNIYYDLPKISISDNAGNSTELYLIDRLNDKRKSISFELPPKPPAGIFDARFVDDKVIELFDQEFKAIEINSASYPVIISFKRFNGVIQDCINGNLINQKLNAEDKLIINDRNITMFKIRPTNLVYDFALYQNYPNPFNPITTIKFSLPEKMNVKISVYDVLGQKIKEIINETKEAGIYTINFDGIELSSGIYFYRIDAGKYSDVKKMILIK